jgi:hypothetical protein
MRHFKIDLLTTDRAIFCLNTPTSATAHIVYYISYTLVVGTVAAQWLRYCATNQKVTGSIPDGVIGIFH